MTGDTHYDLDTLADLAEGLLDAGKARQVRDHLAVCDPCGELLADLAGVREVLAATPTPAMPMGVALRIDKALAAEAESRKGGVGLAETPDWDELMRDAPWERTAAVYEPAFGRAAEPAVQEPAAAEPAAEESERVPEPVRLGVVADDGSVVPAALTGRRASRRRRWAMPAVAAAAAAAVVGTAVVSTGMLASGTGSGGAGRQQVVAQPSTPTRAPARGLERPARPYALTDSGHNYSDAELRQPLEGVFGPAPIFNGGSEDAAQVAKCVERVSSRTKLTIFAVDQGQYNGQEAVIMASRKSENAKKIRLDIVDPFRCKNLRKPTIGRW
ncbi:anti-sigma factor family protein [Nonomuraea sp. NPDC047897]|uniref:anti-sigma factor family protein n=1 Tax=Nonomuraea sp. NPDC047897 TaxID=3364346 RepID=UPI003710DE4B